MVRRSVPHVAPGRPHRAHRPQAERVEAMRARLLDATIDCLAERGYRRTSTNDIVRRAHVSRGALAHHFPTRVELISAAAERLIAQRAEQFRARFVQIGPEQRTPAEALRVLWSFYDSPGGAAMLELTVAARNEPELRAVLTPVSEHIIELTTQIFGEFFPDQAELTGIEQAHRAIHLLFLGMSLTTLALGDRDGHAAEVRAFVQQLAELAPLAAATTVT